MEKYACFYKFRISSVQFGKRSIDFNETLFSLLHIIVLIQYSLTNLRLF